MKEIAAKVGYCVLVVLGVIAIVFFMYIGLAAGPGS